MMQKQQKSSWSEEHIQQFVVMMARRNGYLVHGDQNGANKGIRGGMRAKAAGALAGWPDLTFLLKDRIVFVELKAKRTAISDAQKDLHPKMHDLGFVVNIVRADDGPSAWEQIRRLLEWRSMPVFLIT